MKLIVNGTTIEDWAILQEVDVVIDCMDKGELEGPRRDLPADIFRLEILEIAKERLIRAAVLFQQAKKEKIEITAEALERGFRDFCQERGGLKAVRKMLAHEKRSVEELKSEIMEQLRIEEMVARVIDSVSDVTEQEAEEYYEANSKRFSLPDRVQAELLYIPFSDLEERKESKTFISQIKKRLDEEADLALVLDEFSHVDRLENGVGAYAKGETGDWFDEIAFQLESGQWSEPLEHEGAFYLIGVIERLFEEDLPFELVKEELINGLNQKRFSKAYDDYVTRLKSEARIEFIED